MNINISIKKIICFALLAALIIMTAAACSSSGGDIKTTAVPDTGAETAAETTTEGRLSDNLPNVDLDGWVMRIIAHHDSLSDESTIYSEEMNGEVINDAIYLRDTNLKSRFNCDIALFHDNGWGKDQVILTNSILAGTRDYDMAFLLPFANSGSVVTNGILHNMLMVDYIDYDMPWWHTNINDLYTYKGYLPFVSSDYLISSYQYANILIFNKNMAKDYGVESIYDLVRQGKWTLDKFKEIITVFSRDVDGNGVFDVNDSYGYATNFGYHAISWGYAIGDLSVTLSDGEVKLGFDNERFYTLAEWLYEILYNSDLAFEIVWDKPNEIDFDTNRVFIEAMWLADLERFRDCESEYGIIPYAKFDEAQEGYYTYVDARTGACAIPIDAEPETISNVGLLLEALSCANYNDIIPEYINSVTHAKYTRDEDSIEMMDYIAAGRRWDVGYTFTSTTSYVWVLMNQLPKSDGKIASHMESVRNSTVAQFEKVLQAYEELAAKYK